MNTDFLQNFLKTGLFDIGENDDRLQQLKSSITDLTKKLEEDKSLLPLYTLVALDPNISDTEPTLIDTEKIITQHWEALRIRYNEVPKNIIRGVILNALYEVGANDTISARIIYLTGIDYYPYAKLNSERSIVENMLLELGESAEKKAVEEWALVEQEPALKLTSLKLSDYKVGEFKLDSAKIEAGFKKGASNPSGYNAANHPQQWGEHFATNSAAGIVDALKETFGSLNKSITSEAIEVPINKFFTEFKKSLDTVLKTLFASITSVERRSKLLWWKETFYSPSLRSSYRGVDKNALPLIMANDLYDQVPEITPISVDYLLQDALYLLNDKKNESLTFEAFLNGISKEDVKNVLKSYFTNSIPNQEGKLSVTQFIALLLNDKISLQRFKERTGIDDKEKITYSDIAVYVFHNLLVQYLISE